MPNRLFQGIVNQMRDTLDRNIGVVDEGGTVIACSELGQIGEVRKGRCFRRRFCRAPNLRGRLHFIKSVIRFTRNMPFFLRARG